MSFFGKSDQERRQESLVVIKKALADHKAAFSKEALAAGFTEAQVDVMYRYISFNGHIHEYVSNGFQTTTQAGTYVND